MNYDLKYKIAVDLIEKGYIIHCTNEEFNSFDSAYIKGGQRGKEGYGFYFSDMPYKPIEYGENWKIVPKDAFNFLNYKTPISLDMFQDDIDVELYRLYDKLDNSRNIREYDMIENEIQRLKKIKSKIGGSYLYDNIRIAIKQYGAETIGQLEYYIPNPQKTLPMLANFYVYLGYDGYETDGIYTIFNFDKLNKNLKNINIEDYQLSESLDLSSFEVKDELNPQFWKNDKLDSKIRLKLLDIADDFTDFLNVDWVKPEDIIITGSLANYNWSVEFSDIDLHVVIDYKKIDKRTDFVAEYFKSKKEIWNQNHQDIKIYGYPVELYVQDKSEPHASSGVYSLETNKWLIKPQRKSPTKANLNAAEKDAESWIKKIDNLMNRYYQDLTDSQKEKVLNDLDKTFDKIKDKRKSGFKNGGDEMNKNNLSFKMLRRNGYLDKIWDKKNEIYDDLMSINESNDNSNVLIIYHRVDWDGYTSGAVALKAFPNADVLGWNYGDPLPNVNMYEKVILVDLTISDRNDYTWMYENADKLIWIDHHSNAITKINNTSIEGIRKDGIGACVLTWNYFFPGQEIPPHIALIGTYDVFRKDGKFADWSDAWSYQLALNQYGPSKTIEDASNKLQQALLFIDEPIDKIMQRIKFGESLEEERSKKEMQTFNNANFVKSNGITICKLIADGQPAMMIKTNSDNHTADLFVIRSVEPLKNEPNKFKIALRVPEKSNVDASKIARQYGGNGHEKAAGCLMTAEEFENL